MLDLFKVLNTIHWRRRCFSQTGIAKGCIKTEIFGFLIFTLFVPAVLQYPHDYLFRIWVLICSVKTHLIQILSSLKTISDTLPGRGRSDLVLKGLVRIINTGGLPFVSICWKRQFFFFCAKKEPNFTHEGLE